LKIEQAEKAFVRTRGDEMRNIWQHFPGEGINDEPLPQIAPVVKNNYAAILRRKHLRPAAFRLR
jgi:hypothetical protein